jgi:hypothetical protein
MTFESFDVVFFTAGFLVPGFIWSAVLSLFIPSRSAAPEVRFLQFLTLSCINHGIWSWALFMIFRSGFVQSHPNGSGIFLGVIIFVSPVALGVLSGLLQQRQEVMRFFNRLGIRTIHPIACAWDWHFSRAKPYWVLVTLKDGTRVYGLFGTRSFAASDPEKRDLYLEEQFRPMETGDWAPVEDTGGVLILADEIAAVEFRKIGEVNYDDES